MRKVMCKQQRGHEQSSPERAIRQGCGLLGFYGGEEVWVEIEYFGGFEYFNTRPYHNYEGWGHGFRVTINGISNKSYRINPMVCVHKFSTPVVVTDECLDCALKKAFKEAEEKRDEIEAATSTETKEED